MVTSMDWNKKRYGIKFFHSISKQGLDRIVDRWKFKQNGKTNQKLIIEQVEPIIFTIQSGRIGTWDYYCAAILYRTEWVERTSKQSA
jgi:hypothetical protein